MFEREFSRIKDRIEKLSKTASILKQVKKMIGSIKDINDLRELLTLLGQVIHINTSGYGGYSKAFGGSIGRIYTDLRSKKFEEDPELTGKNVIKNLSKVFRFLNPNQYVKELMRIRRALERMERAAQISNQFTPEDVRSLISRTNYLLNFYKGLGSVRALVIRVVRLMILNIIKREIEKRSLWFINRSIVVAVFSNPLVAIVVFLIILFCCCACSIILVLTQLLSDPIGTIINICS
ncbi:hypothetical protein D6810_02770, partial [Candidatus Dojkabacteria bacterium]